MKRGLVEREFAAFADEIGLWDKAVQAVRARRLDGESFVQQITNDRTSLGLDVVVHESELVQMPPLGTVSDWTAISKNYNDGIHYDTAGNVVKYDLQRYHPGDERYGIEAPISVPADQMVHLFTIQRPGQRRGVSEILPGLPLCALLRRWTLATVTAAETAASFAAMLHIDGSAVEDDIELAEDFETLEITRGMASVLPVGYDVRQMKAEQPTSSYAEVKKEFIIEFAAAIGVPANVALNTSEGYNYSSARTDMLRWVKTRRVDRANVKRQLIDPVFNWWRKVAVLTPGYLDDALRSERVDWSHSWFFDEDPHADPETEANARKINLENGSTNIPVEATKAGRDWEEDQELRIIYEVREKELREQHGLTKTQAEPEKPETQAEPEKPETQAEPEKPETQAEPEKPETQAEPVGTEG